MIDTGVGDDDQTWLFERTGDVVGERTRGESTSNGLCTGVGSELEDGTVAVGACRDYTDIVGVLDRGDDTSSEDKLLPGLSDVQDVDT